MILGGDGLHRTLHQNGVEQTQPEPDTEEDADHRMTQKTRGQRHQSGNYDADGEQAHRPECNGRKHQRRVMRWRRHGVTSIPRSRVLSQ